MDRTYTTPLIDKLGVPLHPAVVESLKGLEPDLAVAFPDPVG